MTRGRPTPPRMHPSDVLRVGGAGLRTRPLRVFLSALGIAIGIAAMVSVVGLTTSGRADLENTLSRLGTNLLRVAPGEQLLGGGATLPVESEAMISRVGPVEAVSAVGVVKSAKVYRNDKVPTAESGGISVAATRLDLPQTVGSEMVSGVWLTEATARFPTVVLGERAARLLGATPGQQVWLGGRWFTVIGVLGSSPLAEELDGHALIGWDAATRYLGFEGHPSMVYVRARADAIPAVRDVLAATASPANPEEVRVSRPSDALAARAAVDRAFAGLMLGLGAVALLVGGVGVANTMVISVLERRSEIGLRRALGATRGQILIQFFTESLLLSALGGVAGAVLGVLVTAGYATVQGWTVVVPAWATVGGVGTTLLVGALAGLYPAVRASRLEPTEALATP